jgi:hypothetical protein
MKSIIAAFILPLFIVTMAILANGSGAGIITLEGYPYAVVICGEATTINAGHEADPQVVELLALAAEMCPAQ